MYIRMWVTKCAAKFVGLCVQWLKNLKKVFFG